jgi:hypothetical protein
MDDTPRTARDITDSQRVFIQEHLAAGRRAFYALKSRWEEILTCIEEHASPHGREMAYKFAGDHMMAVPEELKAMEEALDAVTLGVNDLETKRLKEKMPGRTVDDFANATDTRL